MLVFVWICGVIFNDNVFCLGIDQIDRVVMAPQSPLDDSQRLLASTEVGIDPEMSVKSIEGLLLTYL